MIGGLVIGAIALLMALIPGPKMNHKVPKSGGVFSPHVQKITKSEFDVVFSSTQSNNFGACVSVDVSTDGIKTLKACDL